MHSCSHSSPHMVTIHAQSHPDYGHMTCDQSASHLSLTILLSDTLIGMMSTTSSTVSKTITKSPKIGQHQGIVGSPSSGITQCAPLICPCQHTSNTRYNDFNIQFQDPQNTRHTHGKNQTVVPKRSMQQRPTTLLLWTPLIANACRRSLASCCIMPGLSTPRS